MSLIEHAAPQVDPVATYTPEDLADIWVASYRFSQGQPRLQKIIIGNLCEEIIPAEVLEDEAARDESFVIARSRVQAVAQSDGHTVAVASADAIQEDFDKNVVKTVQHTDIALLGLGTSLDSVVGLMLERDAHFMPANKHKNPRKFGTANNRYFSYAVRYILLLQQTPHPAIDTLFERAQDALKSQARDTIYTYDWPRDTIKTIKNTFALQDVLDAHTQDNQRDVHPVRQALAKLGIEQPATVQESAA